MLRLIRSNSLLAASAIAAIGCNGVSWPNDREVTSVRVLGVRAEQASFAPGQTSRLSMLCADGSRGGTQSPACVTEVAWFADCNNPKNNDPLTCIDHYASWVEGFSSSVADTDTTLFQGAFAVAPTFDFTAPNDVLGSVTTVSGQAVHYGTSYVFFAACAGRLVAAKGVKGRLPLDCRDPQSNELLGASHFVIGVTTLYSYDQINSANPELDGVRFDEQSVPTAACIANSDCGAGFGCSSDGLCAPVVTHCDKNIRNSCVPHCLQLDVSVKSFFLSGLDGLPIASPKKSVWVDYYTNAGAVPDDARYALHAPATNSDVSRSDCALWRAPMFPTTEAHLWAVVRDDRGGLTWRDQRIIVK